MSGEAGQSLAEKREAEELRLRDHLDDWKEILVHAKRVVDWEEAFHPAVVFGVVTILFLLLWWAEPTFLSFLSLLLLFVAVVDYLLPFILPRLFPSDGWNADLQNRYFAICASLVGLKYDARALFFRAQEVKIQRPRLYLALTSVALLLVAWIGSALGDFTLLYLLSLVVALYPGAIKNPTIEAKVNNVIAKVKDLLTKEKPN